MISIFYTIAGVIFLTISIFSSHNQLDFLEGMLFVALGNLYELRHK